MNNFFAKVVNQCKRSMSMIVHIPTFREICNDIGTSLELFSAWRRNRYRTISKPTAVTLVLALLYLAIPFDILPDIFPLLGFIDDIAVLKIVADAIRFDLNKFRIWQRFIEESAKKNSSSPNE